MVGGNVVNAIWMGRGTIGKVMLVDTEGSLVRFAVITTELPTGIYWGAV
jgi:hypothetical protein